MLSVGASGIVFYSPNEQAAKSGEHALRDLPEIIAAQNHLTATRVANFP